MRTQFLNQTTGGMGPPRVFSTYTYTTVIMFFKNCEFGEYASVASAYVKDSGTLDSSNNYLRMEPQTIRLKLDFSQWECHYAIDGKIRTVVILYMILLLTSPNDVFFHAGKNTTILFWFRLTML